MHMIGKAKALGLALIAVFAMSAIAASGAQAETWFHSDTNPTVITGSVIEQTKFVTSGGTWKCNKEEYKATSTGVQNGSTWTTKTITFTPIFGECTAFGFVGATIDVDIPGHECGYLYHLTNNTPPTATVDIECKHADEDITVTSPFCTMHIEQQTGLAHVVFTNEGATTDTKDLLTNVTLTGIKYTETAGCLGGHNGETQQNGTESGKATLKGFVDVEEPYKEGAQKGIWIE
jgi:hypothetical protein